MQTGDPNTLDSRGSMEWLQYLDIERLFHAWAPNEESPWMPYHCVPLFAAVGRVPNPGPPLEEIAAEQEAGLDDVCASDAWPPEWTGGDAWVIVDLPGPRAVAFGARLVAAGMQPVCTFDHWPDPKGLLKAEDILAQLIRHAGAVEHYSASLPRNAPPVWICDSQRLGLRRGLPNEFDNRYFLDDSILPGLPVLGKAGLRRAVYVTEAPDTRPTEDLNIYFDEIIRMGFRVERAALGDASLQAVELKPALPLRRNFNRNEHRSSAGGFGRLVPEPSSGGG